MQGAQGSGSALLRCSDPSPSSSSQPLAASSTSISSSAERLPTREEIFNSTLSGARPPPLLPRLASDPDPRTLPILRSLPRYVEAEGGTTPRLQRLRALWEKLPASLDAQAAPVNVELNLSAVGVVGESEVCATAQNGVSANREFFGLTPERVAVLRELYFEELAGRCGGSDNERKPPDRKGKSKSVDWDGFLRYADEKEEGMPLCLSKKESIAHHFCRVVEYFLRAGLRREWSPGCRRMGCSTSSIRH